MRVMSGRSTRQLLALLRERDDYVPDAVAAAMAELKRRGVSAFDVSNAWDDGELEAEARLRLASIPLQKSWKIFWLLLPFLALTPLGAFYIRRYVDGGYRRRSIQFLEAVIIGFTGYLILLMLYWRYS